MTWNRKFYYIQGKYYEKESIIRSKVWWEEKYYEKDSIYDKESVMKKKF